MEPALRSIQTTLVKQLLDFVATINTYGEGQIIDHKELLKLIGNVERLSSAFTKKYGLTESYDLICQSLDNMTKFDASDMPKAIRFARFITTVFRAISTYMKFMMDSKDKRVLTLEQKLFQLAFSPEENGFDTKVLPVYCLHNEMLMDSHPFVFFSLGDETGKTHCVPFISSIRACVDRLRWPYTIITQPSQELCDERFGEFFKSLGDTVHFTRIVSDMVSYCRFKTDKPVIGIFTPLLLLQLFSELNHHKIDIFNKTRFILDDSHERTMFFDYAVSYIAAHTKGSDVPFCVMMMSSAPDSNLFKCFGKVERYTLPYSQPFHITEASIRLNNFDESTERVRAELERFIIAIADTHQQPGHFCIFTSGNKRMRDIYDLVIKINPKNTAKFVNHIPMIDTTDIKSVDEFNYKLPRLITSDDAFYILPILLNDKSRQIDIQIACTDSPQYSNLIKIIICTEAVAVPTSIGGIICVIDCGIHHSCYTDKFKAVRCITEAQTTVKSSLERKALLGAEKNGVYIHFLYRDFPPLELGNAEIRNCFPSSYLLRLKTFNIDAESNTVNSNLPEPIPKKELQESVAQLISMGALDQNHHLTPLGKDLSLFEDLPPYMSKAILDTAQSFGDIERQVITFLTLASLVILSKDFVVDAGAPNLRKIFETQSDVITLVKAICELQLINPDAREQSMYDYGFSFTVFSKIDSAISRIITNYSLKPDEVYQWILKYPKGLELVSNLIDSIGKLNPDWARQRKATFVSIGNLDIEPKIFYQTEVSYGKGSAESNFIELMRRPGAAGMPSPGKCYILNLDFVNDANLVGSMVHADVDDDSVPHPVSIETDAFMNNPFTETLIKAYIGKDRSKFIIFTRNDENNSDEAIVHIDSNGSEKAIVTYAPKNEEANTVMKNALRDVRVILPFTPRAMAVWFDMLNCAVVIYSNGTDRIHTRVHYPDSDVQLYKLTRRSIVYLASKSYRLNNVEGSLLIAMNCRNMTYALDRINFNFNVKTKVAPTTECANGCALDNDVNNIFIISDQDFPAFKKLTWTNRKEVPPIPPELMVVKCCSRIFPGVVKFEHQENVFFVIKENVFSYTGYVPAKPKNDEDNGLVHKAEKPVTDLLEWLAHCYVSGSILTEDIKLKHFVYDTFRVNFKKMREYKSELQAEFSKKCSQLKELQSRERNLNNKINSPYSMEHECLKVVHTSVKNSVEEQQEVINSMKKEMRKLDTYMLSAKADALQIKKIAKKMGNPLRYIANSSEDKSNLITKITQLFPGAIIDIVPMITAIISNKKDLCFSKDKFMELVEKTMTRFGAVAAAMGTYVETPDSAKSYGYVTVKFYHQVFCPVVATEIYRAFMFEGRSIIDIPDSIVNPLVADTSKVNDAFQKWLEKHNLNLKKVRNRLIGEREEIMKANKLLRSAKTRPNVGYTQVRIPDGADLALVALKLRERNKKKKLTKWVLDTRNRVLVVPLPMSSNDVNTFFKNLKINPKFNENEIAGDDVYYCHNAAVLSSEKLPIYYENGYVSYNNYCKTCVEASLWRLLECFYSELNDTPIIHRIISSGEPMIPLSLVPCREGNAGFWPVIPLGQLVTTLYSDPSLAHLVKTYMTAYVSHALHHTPKLTFCPCHPAYIWKFQGIKHKFSCLLSTCPYLHCANCHMWHPKEFCASEEPSNMAFRYCPNCRAVVLNKELDNHIECKCGKHFCYYCCAGPYSTASDTYTHMLKRHGGHSFCPPDLRRMLGDESVTDRELSEFYKAYPHLHPSKFKNWSEYVVDYNRGKAAIQSCRPSRFESIDDVPPADNVQSLATYTSGITPSRLRSSMSVPKAPSRTASHFYMDDEESNSDEDLAEYLDDERDMMNGRVSTVMVDATIEREESPFATKRLSNVSLKRNGIIRSSSVGASTLRPRKVTFRQEGSRLPSINVDAEELGIPPSGKSAANEHSPVPALARASSFSKQAFGTEAFADHEPEDYAQLASELEIDASLNNESNVGRRGSLPNYSPLSTRFAPILEYVSMKYGQSLEEDSEEAELDANNN